MFPNPGGSRWRQGSYCPIHLDGTGRTWAEVPLFENSHYVTSLLQNTYISIFLLLTERTPKGFLLLLESRENSIQHVFGRTNIDAAAVGAVRVAPPSAFPRNYTPHLSDKPYTFEMSVSICFISVYFVHP